MTSSQTKQRILDAAARLIHENGYANTGMAAILSEAGVPKGSFYHHFQSKEHLALELVDHYARLNAAIILPILEDASLPPLERLRAMLLCFRDIAADREYRLGCPLGKLVQELAEINEPVRLRLQKRFRRVQGRIADILQEAQAAGALSVDADPEALALVVQDGWQGALLRMKLERNSKPLDTFLDVLFNQILR